MAPLNKNFPPQGDGFNNGKRPPRNGKRYQVLAYLRVSHEAQGDNYTFETQLQRIREKLDSFYGKGSYDIKVYQDNGLSGAYGPRPTPLEKRTRRSLAEIEKDLQSGQYDALAVYSTNRFFRSPRWFFQYLEDVIFPAKVDFLSATENMDFNSTEGRAMMGIVAVVNASYRDGASQRAKDAQCMRVEAGYQLGSPPYGWVRQKKSELDEGQRSGIEPHPQQREIVIWIKEQYLGGSNCVDLARALNERGWLTAMGCHWSAGTVMDVLKNPIHAGYVHSSRRGHIKGRHYEQRFYDYEVWQQIMALCEQRKERWKTNTGKAKTPHLINGTATCARCGKRLYIANTTARYRNYRCQTGANQGQRTCPDVSVKAETLENAVVRELMRLGEEPQIRALLQREASQVAAEQDTHLEAELRQLEVQHQEINGRRARLVDALGRGLLDDEAYKVGNEALQTEESAIAGRIEELKGHLQNRRLRELEVQKLSETVLNFPLCWEHLTLDEKRLLLSTMIEELQVDRDKRDVTVEIKVHCLPRRTLNLLVDKPHHSKPKPTGLQSLTPRQLLFLHYHVGLKKNITETAFLMGIKPNNAHQFTKTVRQRMEIRDLGQIYAMARERIEAMLENIPPGSGHSHGARGHNPILTENQLEVLRLLAQHHTKREIAEMKRVPMSTITSRYKSALSALRVKTLREAIDRLRDLGLLTDEHDAEDNE